MVGGLGGMILGAVLGVVTFGTVALCTTKLEAFHNMYLPQYLIVRYRDSKNSKTLELPLILASGNQKIVQQEGIKQPAEDAQSRGC